MVTEDLINRIAARVAQNVGVGATANPAGNAQRLLLIFSSEIGPNLSLNPLLASIRDFQGKANASVRAVLATRNDRALDQLKQSLPDMEFISPDTLPEAESNDRELLNQSDLIIIPDLTLPFAAKLVAFQADVPSVNLCLQALLRRQRVLAITDHLAFAALDPGNGGGGLTPGLTHALGELMNKLQSLGIELCKSDELGPLLRPGRRVNPLPVLPRFSPLITGVNQQHPSQELFNVPEQVTEFVDFLETRQCVLEPDKPCCGRGECRSRGF